jgi:predicted short-subunit dehydrogenase-like oxidoreductase (DUF2520 family)
MKISFIGIGRLGGALALALAEKGFEVENLITRHAENAEEISRKTNSKILGFDVAGAVSSDVIFITTRDSEIETIAENLAVKLKNKPIVFHTSGSLSSEILRKLNRSGCRTGSLHPLVSISDANLGKERFKGAYFCVEGDREAVKIAEEIVEKLEGKAFSIETKYKTLYHASAVMSSGHLTALLDTAIETLARCGLEKSEAQKVLLPLIESSVENLKTQTPAQALTGTFARADVGTFRRHLAALRENVSEEVLETYLQLGVRSAHLAQERNAGSEDIETMRREILLAKNNLKC